MTRYRITINWDVEAPEFWDQFYDALRARTLPPCLRALVDDEETAPLADHELYEAVEWVRSLYLEGVPDASEALLVKEYIPKRVLVDTRTAAT